MRNKQTITFKVVAVLTALAVLNTGCVIEDILGALGRYCETTEWTVTTTEDLYGGRSGVFCTAENCSLRQAVATSNTCPGTQTIRIPAGTYVLTLEGTGEDLNRRGDLDVTDSADIVGESGATVDGNAIDRVFDIRPGTTVSMRNLTISNGHGDFGNNGAGIRNFGNFTAANIVITSNYFTIGGNGGAGLYNAGTASISHSAIVDNHAEEGAGGITSLGELKLDNVTISRNRGYGLFLVDFPTHISFSTIADNYPSQQIWNTALAAPERVQISNSIISGTAGDGNCYRPVASLGFNIDSAAPGSERTCALGQPSDLIGVDPLLQPLADNGGGTFTQALDPASPAIDSADAAGCPGTDQRGVRRPQGAACDRGAFELQYQIRPTSVPAAMHTPTASAAASAVPTILLTRNAFCRKGPATAYEDVTAFEKRQSLQIDGRSQDLPRWWLVLIPNSNAHCWVSDATGTVSGNTDDVQIASAPPLPDDAPPSGLGGESAPAAPSKLAITDRKCTSNKYSVTLGWNDNADNETGYHIYRNGTLIATLGANATSYTDNPPGSGPYTYSVEAFNAAGASAQPTVNEEGCLI